MPAFKVYYQYIFEAPEIEIVAKDEDTALAAYKTKWEKGELPGKFIEKSRWKADKVWEVHP